MNVDNRLDLLLAHADDPRPVLENGLDGDAAQRGPRPRKAVRGDDSPDWRRTDADPNDLPAQRWAVIALEGREGGRMPEAITPLLRLREDEQRAPVTIHRVPADMSARAAVTWKDEVSWSEESRTDAAVLAADSVASKAAAVLAMLRGDEAPRAIAQRAGVSLEELWKWVDGYRSGGRARLSS